MCPAMQCNANAGRHLMEMAGCKRSRRLVGFLVLCVGARGATWSTTGPVHVGKAAAAAATVGAFAQYAMAREIEETAV